MKSIIALNAMDGYQIQPASLRSDQINLNQPSTGSTIIGLSQIGYVQNGNTNMIIYQLQCVPVLNVVSQTPVMCPPSVPVTISDSIRIRTNSNVQCINDYNNTIPNALTSLFTINNHTINAGNAFKDISSSNNSNPTCINNHNTNSTCISTRNTTCSDDNRLVQYYECNKCDKRFRRKSNLICHQKIHGPNAKICSFCNKKFARNCNLQQHIRVHTGEKPYKCKLCNKTFKQQHSLKYHTRLHLGQYPYQCNYCQKRFVAKCNYTVHIRTHTGEKPYACSFCDKKYASKSGLNSHCQRIHS